ncbi:MAG TPA: PEPxxWA-CTERM sorting domain-containing protein [Sphingomicrobium sp.]|nr:PEPxxWA-CTERM sorting domain-containing protein [Sphingomicrobium sp.]
MRALAMVLAASAAISFGSAAQAAITLTAVAGTNPYTGPVPTYDFESPAPVSGGLVTNTSVGGIRAQPFGSTGNYWTVGPSDGSPGLFDLSGFGDINSISFIWGSTDPYNTLEVLDGVGGILATFTGINAYAFANGDQTSPFTNPLVTLLFDGADVGAATTLRLSSGQNAFETDNYTINAAVPEPATWATMLFGFGAIGFAMRRRRKPALLAQAA